MSGTAQIKQNGLLFRFQGEREELGDDESGAARKGGALPTAGEGGSRPAQCKIFNSVLWIPRTKYSGSDLRKVLGPNPDLDHIWQSFQIELFLQNLAFLIF